jgi:hypothetical protein
MTIRFTQYRNNVIQTLQRLAIPATQRSIPNPYVGPVPEHLYTDMVPGFVRGHVDSVTECYNLGLSAQRCAEELFREHSRGL